ncbi:acylphosphatase [Candidatus Hydrogenedentota bacterium]
MATGSDELVRAHIWVTGRVQGVCFRMYTVDEARRHDVSGWVSNLLDGRVEAVIEGHEEGVKRIVNWCRHGPLYASVANLELRWEKYRGEFHTFAIR